MKGKKCIIIVLIAVLIIGALTAGFFLLRGKTASIKDGVASDLLYWNVEGSMYTQSGDSTREKAEDGYYYVLFATEGAIVEYKVADDELMQEIDSENLMGLVINEDDIITGKLDVEEITAGEIAPYCYVMSSVDGKIVANSASKGQGMETVFEVTNATNIYDVSGKADFVGEEVDKVSTFDRIRAFVNDEKEVTHVYIIGHYQSYDCETEEGWCEHCNQTVEWMLWEEVDELPVRSGHFRLMYDVMLPEIQAPIEEDESVIVDLNGHTATGPYNMRVFALFFENSYLAILDQSALETGTLIAEGATDEGGVVWVRYGTFELFSGTLDASNNVSVLNGSAVYVNPDATFNMYGGTIVGGTAKANIKTGQTGVRGGYAGSVCVASGATFNMYDGVIRDGKAVSYTNKDGSVVGGEGGNVWACDKSVVNIYGGEILNGTAEVFAGNLLIATDATVTMKDGLISGGKVTGEGKNGGNIVIGERGVLNLEGGIISDGMSLNCGANIALYGVLNMSGGIITGGKHMEGKTLETAKQVASDDENVFCVNGILNMSGGQIAGHVEILDHGTDAKGNKKECTVKLSGDAKINGGTTNLKLNSGDVVELGSLNKNASIYITGKGYVSTDTIASNASQIHSDYKGVNVHYHNKKIFIGELHCVCGNEAQHYGKCDGTILEWLPWTTKDSAPLEAGNWYLTDNISVASQQGIVENATLRLDLNGYQITGAVGERVYNTYGGNIDFTITDCSKDRQGRFVANGDSIQNGGAVWVASDSTVTMYAGKLDAFQYKLKHNGASVFVDKGSNFVMYGGTIQGGQSAINEKGIYGFGGSVYVEGTFDMYDGVICDGKSEWSGGNVAVNDGGAFHLYGGTIQSGKASVGGGNIYVLGTMDMTGGKVQDGFAQDFGGNVYVAQQGRLGEQYGTMSIKGGDIKLGKTGGTGGNIYIDGIFKMSGGMVRNGVSAKNVNSGNVYYYQMQSRDSFEMSGGFIQGLVSMTRINDMDMNFALSGTAQITGETTNLVIPRGFVIQTGDMKDSAKISVTGAGTIADCSSSKNVNYFTVDKDASLGGAVSVNYVADSKTLVVGKVPQAGSCICGMSQENGDKEHCYGDCDGKWLVWEPWTEKDSLPITAGNYYLTNDVITAGQTTIDAKSVVNVDLNGHTVSNNTTRIYSFFTGHNVKDVTLVITDHSNDKQGAFVSELKEQGSLLWISDASNTVSIYGGILDGSKASTAGSEQAAVDVQAGTFNLYGGTVKGNANAEYGRAVSVYSGATFNMEGGSITGGTGNDGNLRVAGTFNMKGGHISGNVSLNNEASVVLGGTAVIESDATTGKGISIPQGTNVTIKDFAQGASVSVNGFGKIAATVKAEDKVYVKLDNAARNSDSDVYVGDSADGVDIHYVDENLYIGKVRCICGMDADGKHFGNCDGEVLVWKAWTSDDSLPRTSGNYYLTKNVNLAGQTGLDDSNQTINLDLNGHTVTAANSRMFISIGQSNLHLNITDLSAEKNGTMKCTHTGDGGSMFYITGATTISLYAGTLDASEAKDAVVLYNTSAFNMYGGTLLGGNSERGSSVHLEDNASFKMTAGSILGGRATYNGGNVCAPLGTTVTIAGGSITGGTAGESGHNVFANGILNLYGGTIGNTEMTSEANAKSETTLVIGGNATVSYKASNQ